MSALSESNSSASQANSNMRLYPRRVRLGGFVMNQEKTLEFALRLLGENYPPNCITSASCDIDCKLMELRAPGIIAFRGVGEDFNDIAWMVVTQAARFDGYKDMPQHLIPQFVEGETETKVRELLRRNVGFKDTDYKFKTVLD
ncbi:hypothetical protein BDQ12DRAFT_735486 [Crucibulum laeve]|uniref:Uncharacterized protein n=1 Tax=Crucibulum laeve TaxID=68775 RepID=A0A5C3M1Z7_9AGAR|nr:hypothetical protein BDQ12DRAFT_735486 [Crucibulum laeve]